MTDELSSKAQGAEEATVESAIAKVKDAASMDEFLPMFNLNMAKKQALRVAKREDVLDMVTDRIKERLEKRPDEISISELTAIDKTMSEQKQKEMGMVNSVNDTPAISVSQTNNITINGGAGMSQESRERVLNAVKNIMRGIDGKKGAVDTSSVKRVDVDDAGHVV